MPLLNPLRRYSHRKAGYSNVMIKCREFRSLNDLNASYSIHPREEIKVHMNLLPSLTLGTGKQDGMPQFGT